MKKITIFYADDLVDAAWSYEKQHNNYDILINQEEFMKLKTSSRVEWVKSSIKDLLSQQLNVAVITNDYTLIKLIEVLAPINQFEIYHADTDVFVKNFCVLSPNPTLDVFMYAYDKEIQKALSGG